ncbi:MAG: hypothetical protein QXO39_06625 [Conexivisphaerales archaeon]
MDSEKLLKNRKEKEAEIKLIEVEFGDIESINLKISDTDKRMAKLNIDELDAVDYSFNVDEFKYWQI